MLPGERTLDLLEWAMAMHVWLGGLLTYFLLRRFGVGGNAAFFGGMVFELGGYFASQAQHLGAVCAVAWMPLSILCIHELSLAVRARWVGGLAASLALVILAGFPALTLVVAGACGLFAAVLAIADWRRAPGLLAAVAGGGLWAVGLSSVQMLPSMELSGLTDAYRRHEWGDPGGGGVPPGAFVSLLIPNYHNVFDFSKYSLGGNPTLAYYYCGLAGILLAAAGAVLWRNRLGVAFAALVAAAPVVMLGGHTPVMRVVYPLLAAPIRSATYLEFAMAALTFGIAVLAAAGFERLVSSRRWLATCVIAATAAELILTSSGRPMNLGSFDDFPRTSAEQFDGSRSVVSTLRGLQRAANPPARFEIAGDSAIWPALPPLLRTPSPAGNDPMGLSRHQSVRNLYAPSAEWVRYEPVSVAPSPVLDMLNVRYLVAWEASASPMLKTGGVRRLAVADGHAFYENPRALARFYLVSGVRRVGSAADGLAVLKEAGFDPRATAVVEGFAGAAGSGGAVGSIAVRRYGDSEFELEVETRDAAYLATSEAHYPGWRAYVDGREAPLYWTNVAYRGLPVAAGRHTVRMEFRPDVLWRGTAVTLAAVGALMWVMGRRAR
jgi:hypothetical protein